MDHMVPVAYSQSGCFRQFALLWLFNGRPCSDAGLRTGLDLVNVTAGSFPVGIPIQVPAKNLSAFPMAFGEGFRGLLGLEWEAEVPGSIEATASGAAAWAHIANRSPP